MEFAFDHEPVLAAGARMTKLFISNNGLRAIMQAGKFYGKSRTSLDEICIQKVRSQAKTIIAHIQDRAKIIFDALMGIDPCMLVAEQVPRDQCRRHDSWHPTSQLQRGLQWQRSRS